MDDVTSLRCGKSMIRWYLMMVLKRRKENSPKR
jgi:hypothetical protein